MELGPARLFICWQSLVLACVIAGIAEALKRSVDSWWGRDKREQQRMIRALTPWVPVLLGGVLAIFVPVRPEWLTAYVEKLPRGRASVFAMWGVFVGMFSSFAYAAVRQMLGRQLPSILSSASTVPPAASPPPSAS